MWLAIPKSEVNGVILRGGKMYDGAKGMINVE